MIEALRSMSTALEQYLDNAERAASEILRRHAIDAASLWDVVKMPDRCELRYLLIDRERASLPPEAEQALDVMWHLRAIRKVGDVTTQRALELGIHLAQAYEHLKTNLAFKKPVLSRRASDQALQKSRPKGRPATTRDRILALASKFADDRNRAGKIAKRARCTPAYVRKVLKK